LMAGLYNYVDATLRANFTREREEREGKRFLRLFCTFAWGRFFGDGIHTSSRSLRLRVRHLPPTPDASRRRA